MPARRAIMVLATKQHTGKTSVSLALIQTARKLLAPSGGTVGYMKPVGQQWVTVEEGGEQIRVDKDAAVAHHYFKLQERLRLSDVSPIVIGRGHTKAFLDGEMPSLAAEAFEARLTSAFGAISAASDFVVVEGTGHSGVGAVLGWNNARVAAALGVEVVLVANGGVGSTFDELSLNVAACRAEKAAIAGIIINKCAPSKVAEVTTYLQKAADRFGWGVPVLACVPYGDDLDKPSVSDLVHLFEGGFSKERYVPSESASSLASMSNLGKRRDLKHTAAAVYATALRYAAGYGGLRASGGGGGSSGGSSSRSDGGGAKGGGNSSVLLAGECLRQRRFERYELVTESLERFTEKLAAEAEAEGAPGGGEGDAAGGVCYVTHVSRTDIIRAVLGPRRGGRPGRARPFGLIIAGSPKHRMAPIVATAARALASDTPVLRSYMPMAQTLAAIKDLTPKMQADDDVRVRQVIDLYAPHLEGAVSHLLRDD